MGEEKLRKEENEKKAKEAEEKKKRLEEAEAKRQEMLEAQKAGAGADKKKIMMKRRKKRRKRKKRRRSRFYSLNKSTFDLPTSLDLVLLNKDQILSAPVLHMEAHQHIPDKFSL